MKDDEERSVLSIVGVGGLGKTTLAKKMYWHNTVKNCFDCCGWSSISQQLNVKDVLGELMKCMSLPADGELQMNEGGLMAKLYNYLQDKRYFIVLDDVWKVDHWNTLSPAFPNGKRGSKVLLTTRNKELALHADPWSIHYEPHMLNEDDSWELLCKKAFSKNSVAGNCYPAHLEKLGREMVRKCGGLPLGICVLGGLLATKRCEIKEWELVHRNVVSCINRGEDGGVNAILALSYHDLPSHLKQCFLYLGLFPEDRAIPRNKLIQLWIAEGFISHTQENVHATKEDIGKHRYLAELIQRCMVQSGRESFSPTKGRKHQVYVHDLMRDLCLWKGKEINFLDRIGNAHSLSRTTKIGKLRRCAVNLITYRDDTKRYDIHFKNSCYALRTLLVIFPWDSVRAPLNYQKFKLLRTLDLENKTEFDKNITRQVSKLIHLRYLAISYVSEISSSIGDLQNLQFLKLGTKGLLPETARKLVQLRHLILIRALVAQKFVIENLVNLQTIAIGAGKWIRKGCLENFPNLQKLNVWDTSRLQTNIILEEIVGKGSSVASSSWSSSYDDHHQNPIRSLRMDTKEGFPNSIFESLSCCHNLHTLDLTGQVEIVNLRKYPPNLVKLSLNDTLFTEDPMAAFQYLPKLRILNLDSCHYGGMEMICSAKGFPQLQYLSLFALESVGEWIIEQGGMPQLKELYVRRSFFNLRMLPHGLRFINTLEKLNGEKWDCRNCKESLTTRSTTRELLPPPRPPTPPPPPPPLPNFLIKKMSRT